MNTPRLPVAALFVPLLPALLAAQDFNQLLDVTEISFPQNPPLWRQGGASVSHDSQDCAVCEALPGTPGELKVDLEGPGRLAYWWKLNGGGEGDKFQLLAASAAGLPVTPLSSAWPSLQGQTNWRREELRLPPGLTRLTWRAIRSALPPAGVVPGAFLDEFAWTPESEPVAVPEALENPALTFSTTGGGQVRGLRDIVSGRTYAVLSLQAGVGGVPGLQVPVPAGHTQVRTSRASVSGTAATVVKDLPGGSGWQEKLLYFSAPGELSVTGNTSGDSVVLDSIITSLTADETLDAPPGVWQTGGYYWPRPDATALNGRYLQLEAAPLGYPGMDGKIDTTVTGSTRVSFKTRGSPLISWNGAPAWAADRLTEWTPVEWTSPPGGGAIQLSGAADVDALTIEPAAEVTAAEAADSPDGIAWTLGSGWHAAADPGSFDGADSIRRTPTAATGTLRADWSGRGTIAWRAREGTSWKTGLNYVPVVSTRLDGTAISQILPFDRWRAFRTQTGPGAHAAEWSFVASTTATPAFTAWVDRVTWQPDEAFYSTAADTAIETWWSEGDDVWSPTTEDSHAGGSALASPAIGPGGDSSISLRVTGPALVKFAWRGRAEEFWNGTGPGNCRLSGPTDWREESHTVTASGPATLTWRIRADFSPLPAGALLVDNVRVLPVPPAGTTPLDPNLAASISDPPLNFLLTSGSTVETVTGVAAQDGGSSLRLNTNATLRTAITAPAEVRFWWKASRANGVSPAPQAGGFVLLDGGPHAEWKQGVVVFGGTGTRTFEWKATAQVELDGITVVPAGIPGTFSATAGTMAQLDWGVGYIGTGALATDAAIAYNGNPSARFGADMTGLAWRSIDGSARRIVWQRRHDEPVFGARLGGPAHVWQAGDFVPPAASGWIDLVTAYNGGHRWLAGLAEAAAPASPGEMLWSHEWPWTVSSAAHWQPVTATAGRLQSTQPGAWLAVEYQGPGWFIAQNVTGRLLVDGAEQISPGTVMLPLGAGAHTVRLEQNSATAATITIPRFVQEVPIPEALDNGTNPGVTVDSVPAEWTGIADRIYAPDGVDAALSPVLTAANSVIHCTITGPGWLRCKSSIYTAGTGLSLRRTPAASLAPVDAWLYFAQGTWPVTLEAASTVSAGARRLVIDLLEFRPDASVPLSPEAAAAMESTGLTWFTSAALPFAELPFAGAANESVAASPRLPAGSSTWLETTIPGPGTLFYYARNLYSTTLPEMSFSTPATAGGDSTGTTFEGAWRTDTTQPVPLRIELYHGSRSQYGDAPPARLVFDRMVWVPDDDPGIPLAEAFPDSGLTFGTVSGIAVPWRAVDMPGWGRCLVSADYGGYPTDLPFTVSSAGTVTGEWWSYTPVYGFADTAGTVWLSPIIAGWWNFRAFLVPQRSTSVLRASSITLLRHPVFTPAPLLSLDEALDTPGRTWITGGAAPWIGTRRSDTADDEVISGQLPAGQSTWIETTVTPPLTVQWTGNLSSRSADTLVLRAGATTLQTVQGSLAFTAQTYTHVLTGTTPVTLRWTYTRDASTATSTSERTASISNVTLLTPTIPVSLTEAADVSGFTLSSGSNAGVAWTGTAGNALQGGSYLALGGPPSPPVPNGTSWLDATVTGPGVFSAAIRDLVHILVDGVEVAPRSAPVSSPDWSLRWVIVSGPGPHTVRLRSSAWNSARVDALRFEPLTPVSAANIPGISFTGDADWIVFGPPARRIVASQAPQFFNTRLHGDVIGPVIFRGTTTGGPMELAVNGTPFTGGGMLFLPEGTHRLTWRATAPGVLSDVSVAPRKGTLLDVPQLLGAPDLITRVPASTGYTAGTANPFTTDQPYLVSPYGAEPSVLLPAAGRLRWAQARVSNSTVGKWNMESSVTSFLPKEITIPGSATSTASHLAALEFVPVPGLSVGSALDDAGCITWTSVRGWHPAADPALSFDGMDALIAEPVLEDAVLEGTVNGPAFIQFSRSALVRFVLNGVLMLDASMSTQPADYFVNLAPGPHTLRWERPVDAPYDTGIALLDRFQCTTRPAPGLPVVAEVGEIAAGGASLWRALVTPPCLDSGMRFYPPTAGPLAVAGGIFTALESRPLTEVFGVDSVNAGGWLGFGIPGQAGGIAWSPPTAGAERSLSFTLPGSCILTIPAALAVSGATASATTTIRANGNALPGAPAGAGIPLIGEPSWNIVLSATGEAAVSGLAWNRLVPENDFAVFTATAGLSGAAAEPGADPDGDGRHSFSEFAFGGNPAFPDMPPAPPLPVMAMVNGAACPAVEFTGTTRGIHYQLQRHTAAGWENTGGLLGVLTETTPLRRARLVLSNHPLPAAEPVILRVIATPWSP